MHALGRSLLAATLSATLAWQCFVRAVEQPASDTRVNIIWRAPSRQSVDILKQLDFGGTLTADQSSQVDGRSPALIYIIAGTVAIERLARTVLTAYRDTQYGGVVIRRDKKGQLLIENKKELPGGTIIVDQGSKGIKVIQSFANPSSGELLDAIQPLLK